MAWLTLPDGTDLFYQDRGQGLPLVFIHSWATSASLFEGQVVAFARDHRVVTFDCRGCGSSDHPATGNTIRNLSADLSFLTDTLELGPHIVIGSSVGGNIAIDYALQDSRGIAGLVLVDAPLHWTGTGISDEFLREWLHRLRYNRADTFETMVTTWFGPRGNDAMRRWIVGLLLQSGWFVDDLLHDLSRHDPRQFLETLNIPTGVFHGALDQDVPLEVAQTAASLLPNAHLVIFDDCAHMPHLENPEVFNNELRTFLSQLI